MIGWNFPSNGGGQWRGIADAGIQTFTGKEILSLARETCQNSLDAIDDKHSAVTVEFRLHEINTNDIPGRDEYEKILRKCRDFWISNSNTKKFFDAAICQINSPKTSVLRISDAHTTGLAEPFNPRAMTCWNTLTKIDGGATKTGDAAGSFGIGKNAPFANSVWRMVFYRTLNLQGERAAQGMARLVSFDMGDEFSAGIGYFGGIEKNSPVNEIPALDKIFKRNQVGTDVFVYGFNGGDDWRENIFVELIENFLVAIHNRKLVLRIQGEDLTRDTLKNFVVRFADKLPRAADYYRVLTGGDDVKTFTQNFHGGQLKLRVIADNRATLNRRVLVARSNGMKLFDMDRFPRGISFTGILELEGDALNEFFRGMETPAHDKWESDRHENPALAREYLTELKRWVRQTILKLGVENFSDEVNVEGLNQMLDLDSDAIVGNTKNFATFEIEPQKLSPDVDTRKDILTPAGGVDGSKTRQTLGDVTDTGGTSAIKTLTGTRKRKTRANHTGEKNSDGKDIILEPVGKQIACKKIRVIKIDAKTYRLILSVAQNISGGRIEIFAVGENGEREKLFVTRARAADSQIQLLTVDEKISFRNLRADKNTVIDFELRDEQNYALGVDVRED